MTRRERQCRGILSTSLLDATVPSDKVGRNSDCETVQTRKENNLFGNGMVVLGLATSHCWKHWNGKAGTPGWSAPASTIMHSFVGMRLHDGRMPPAKLEVLHLFRWFTHTNMGCLLDKPTTTNGYRWCGCWTLTETGDQATSKYGFLVASSES